MIDVSNVRHHYGIRPILQDISFRVSTGNTLAIVGPNGSGKTTLLNLTAGLMTAVEGTISIDGIRRRDSVESELQIRQKTVFVPAVPWFPTNITGRQFLLAVGEIWAVDDRRCFEHVDQLLQVFQLENLADAAVSAYSTGQQKKLMLCSALVSDASILLLDEPFSGGLDPAGMTALKRILKHLTDRQDRTVVLTSPVPELIEEVADEVLILQDSRILQHDTVDNIKRNQNATSLDEALRQLIFPETEDVLREYFSSSTS